MKCVYDWREKELNGEPLSPTSSERCHRRDLYIQEAECGGRRTVWAENRTFWIVTRVHINCTSCASTRARVYHMRTNGDTDSDPSRGKSAADGLDARPLDITSLNYVGSVILTSVITIVSVSTSEISHRSVSDQLMTDSSPASAPTFLCRRQIQSLYILHRSQGTEL